eukprot:SAG31_NODE_932_length_10913_cov_3.933235_4_plen_74_part_00
MTIDVFDPAGRGAAACSCSLARTHRRIAAAVAAASRRFEELRDVVSPSADDCRLQLSGKEPGAASSHSVVTVA